MFPFRTKKRTVWLITWEYNRDDYFEHLARRTIVAVLDSRASDDFVTRYLPLLYSTERQLLNYEKYDEMYIQSLKRYRDPNWRDVTRDCGSYTFGGKDPWLKARLVDNFFIDVLDYENEEVFWTEREVYRRTKAGKLELVQPSRFVKLVSHSGVKVTEKTYFGNDAIPPRKARKPTE